jgi:hypothetical protein
MVVSWPSIQTEAPGSTPIRRVKREKVNSEFQKYLEKRNHISSWRNDPQTNGTVERCGREYKQHRNAFNIIKKLLIWYNNRIH